MQSCDSISKVTVSSLFLPLARSVSDAKVLAGRQVPLAGISILLAEIQSEAGYEGLGFGYALRAGAPAQFAHAKELAPLLVGEDPNDISRIWQKLAWAGATIGKAGAAAQAIAAFDIALWDMKAKRANLPLAKLLGAQRNSVRCYNTSGGYLQASIEDVIASAEGSLARGMGGIKLKVGQPDWFDDIARVESVRSHFGDRIPIMVDANQQWDRAKALRVCKALDQYQLEWIEEPLDSADAAGHAKLADALDTPIGTGEMLTSVAEHQQLINRGVDLIMPDAPRIGGITPFLRVMALAEEARLSIAPHFVMELHIHLAAACASDTWVEHFEWLEPLWNERLKISDGRMSVPMLPGVGLSLSDYAKQLVTARYQTGP